MATCWLVPHDEAGPCGGPATYEVVIAGVSIPICSVCARLTEQAMRDDQITFDGVPYREAVIRSAEPMDEIGCQPMVIGVARRLG